MRNVGTAIAVILGIVLLVVLLGGAGMMGFGGFGMGGMMGRYGGYGMPGFGGFAFNPIGWIISLALWGLIIAGAVLLILWLVRSLGQPVTAPPRGEGPLDILKARYAKGEITKEQFEQMKRDLGG